jgi:hypothetical protein
MELQFLASIIDTLSSRISYGPRSKTYVGCPTAMIFLFVSFDLVSPLQLDKLQV